MTVVATAVASGVAESQEPAQRQAAAAQVGRLQPAAAALPAQHAALRQQPATLVLAGALPQPLLLQPLLL
jgi:hypothetical protein